jgi:hypothetical protein
VPPAMTSIVCQPLGTSVDSGLAITLAVGVSNASGVSYAWRKDMQPLSDGPRISGSQTGILNITPTEPGDSGSYDCIVTTACQTLPSSAAAVEVFCRADFNRNGTASVQDIFDFLAVYFAGCP